MSDENKFNVEELKQVIEEKSDFSFEMKILNKIKNYGYKTVHSGTYLDPYTKLNREFDIRGRKECAGGKYIKLAVECKNFDPEVPIVIHSVLSHKKDLSHSILIEYSNLVDEILNEKKRASTFPTIENPMHYMWERISSHEVNHRSIDNNVFHSLYSNFEFIGKSLDKVNRKRKGQDKGKIYFDDSEIYSKYSQAINSLCELIIECESGEEATINQFLLIPVLVVPNKSLYEVKYNDDGEIVSGPSEANRLPFFIDKKFDKELGKNFPSHKIHYLEIVTENGLDNLLNEVEGEKDFDNQPSFLGEDELKKVSLEYVNKFLN
ncbi:MAG: hypothetical protein H6621_09935 [Halobacteriovoraceae bacterium]|nr:hypothetical protein [Halobacteriovoraceae bacterium]MCB9095377.1 hypothetical protein [Halobacteriovoraceae bacterium]